MVQFFPGISIPNKERSDPFSMSRKLETPSVLFVFKPPHGDFMDCPECEKKDKRIKELEQLNSNMAESFDNLFLLDDVRGADQIDFVQEVGN